MLIDVALEFANQLRLLLPDRPDLLRTCVESPRKNLVLNNLCAEVLKFEKTFGRLGSPQALKQKRDYLINQVAVMFVNSVIIEHRSKKIVPEKSALEKVEERANQARDFLGDSLVEGEGKATTLG